MESFNQIGPWIAVGVLFASVLFFCIFYILRLVKTKKATVSLTKANKVSDDMGGSVTATISKEQQKKLKAEIVHDIVADITPVLEKRLEKAF